jgi:glycosyltransferase involved in cell wall biosynthesis
MAVIATTLGAEGLVIEDNREILVRDEPDAFAEGVMELLRNRELRLRIASSGKNYVLRHHLPAVAGESLESLYKDLLSKAGRG